MRLLRDGKYDGATEIYWQLHPARKVKSGLAASLHGGWFLNRQAWKFQGWLQGYNGGPLRMPTQRIHDHQMAALRKGLLDAGLTPSMDPFREFFTGRQPETGIASQASGFEKSPLVTLFSLREVTFPAWTLAAFAIGVLAGMLIRRVVPAIVATLAIYAGLAIATAGLLRERYLTPLVTASQNVPGTAWIISQWWTRHGRFAFTGNPPISLLNQFCKSPAQTSAQCPPPRRLTHPDC